MVLLLPDLIVNPPTPLYDGLCRLQTREYIERPLSSDDGILGPWGSMPIAHSLSLNLPLYLGSVAHYTPSAARLARCSYLCSNQSPPTEYTQSGKGHFLAYIPSIWQNQPSLVRVGGARPTTFILSTTTTKAVVYATAERADLRGWIG
jgi:hypothetical protein